MVKIYNSKLGKFQQGDNLCSEKEKRYYQIFGHLTFR